VPRAVITVPVFAVDRTTPQGFTLYIERLRHQRTVLDDLKEAESSVGRCTGVEPLQRKIGAREWNIVPGAPTDQSAYRSEVAGLFGIATMTREICAFHDLTAGTVYLGCDGLSVLLNCIPHFDLITATRAMLQQCPVKRIQHQVLGHQDDDPDVTVTAIEARPYLVVHTPAAVSEETE
jgi:hypothetical protein